MYKIYINETPLLLVTTGEVKNIQGDPAKNMTLRYSGKKKFLLNIIDQLEKSGRFESVAVFSDDLQGLWADFQDVYKIIEAAGGIVFNPEGKVLIIYRRGHKDLPKGKIDKGETPEQAALREVEEETGLHSLRLGQHVTDTWHTYHLKGKRILKKTWWYSMYTNQLELIPQTEEDIESAEWTDLTAFLQNPGKTYGNILDLLVRVADSHPADTRPSGK